MVSYPGGAPMGPSMASTHTMNQYVNQQQNGMPVGNLNARGPPMNMAAQQPPRMPTAMLPLHQMSNMQRVVPTMNMPMHKPEQNANNRFSVANCLISPYRLPQPPTATRFRTTTPQRESYHVSSPQQFISAGTSNVVTGNQNPMRGMSAAPTPTPPQQQDMQKQQQQQMTSHSYGMPTQAQTQARPQMSPYQPFRNNGQQPRQQHHGHRPPSSGLYPSSQPTGPTLYVVTPQLYGQGFNQRLPTGFMHPPLPHQLNQLVYPYPSPPCFYPANGQSLPPTSTMAANAPGGRSHAPTPVNSQGVGVTLATQPVVPHPSAQQQHLHQNQGIRHQSIINQQQPTNRRKSCAITIINPLTLMEVVPDTNVSQQSNSEVSSERQSPQPETISIVQEFKSLITAAASPADNESKSDTHPPSPEVAQSDTSLATPANEESVATFVVNETPIVSAISDSPEIVPKVKNQIVSEQNIILDTNKNISNKQLKPVAKPGSKISEETKQAEIVQQPQPQRVNNKRHPERSSSFESVTPVLPEKQEVIAEEPEAVPVNGPSAAGDVAVSEETPEVTKVVTIEQIKQPAPQIELPVPKPSIILSINSESLETVLEVEPELIKAEELSSEKEQSPLHSRSTLSEVELTKQSSLNQFSNTETKMKDIDNASTKKITDLDAANGNAEPIKDNGNYLECDIKSDIPIIDSKAENVTKALPEMQSQEAELNANHQGEGEKIDNPTKTSEKKTEPLKKVHLPKYTYSEGQWSPFNKSGSKVYSPEFILQLREDPKSLIKPDFLSMYPDLVRMMKPENMSFSLGNISRSNNDALLPSFANIPQRGSAIKEPRKSSMANAKQSIRGGGGGSGSMSGGKNVIHLSLRSDVKLNEAENAWKPSRLVPHAHTADEEDSKAQDLYKKVRSVLNKLTPEKFETLLDQVKKLEINTEEKLSKVIDLVFDKAVDEPNFSVAYAKMCKQLGMLAVPSQNNPSELANFSKMLIMKCQKQFESKEQQSVKAFEEELSSCKDPVKRKEIELTLEEEKRKVRMKSVGNVRFIGELYKLNMLTEKIMAYCMKYLLDVEENEQQLECLCKLLNTIGAQFEREEIEKKNTTKVLNEVFNKMQNIVDRKNKSSISSRVRFMLQDVIELRKRKWTRKNEEVPKTMGEIQKEAELQHKNIELINSSPMSNRRDDGRGKRNDNRRGGSASNSVYEWSKTSTRSYPDTIDTSKLKAGTNTTKNVKLAPPQWGGIRSSSLTAPAPISPLTTNKYSMLDNTSSDPPPIKSSKDSSPAKGTSQERSSHKYSRPYSGSTSQKVITNVSAPVAPQQLPQSLAQIALSPKDADEVQSLLDEELSNPRPEEFLAEIKERFQPQYHADFVYQALYRAADRKQDTYPITAGLLFRLLSNNIVSSENFCEGLGKILEDPDLSVDVPLLYVYLATIVLQPIRAQCITLQQLYSIANKEEISPSQRKQFLAALLKTLRDDMGPSFVRSKWHESKLKLSQWIDADDVPKFVASNKLAFLEGDTSPADEGIIPKKLKPEELQSKLKDLIEGNTNVDVVKKWIQESGGDESWVTRSVTTVVVEHALGPKRKLKEADMDRWASLLTVNPGREADVLIAIQLLVDILLHPQGVTLSIFKYLWESDIICKDDFLAWKKSAEEPVGKAVVLKALVSFFTEMEEADNEDSCGEETPNI